MIFESQNFVVIVSDTFRQFELFIFIVLFNGLNVGALLQLVNNCSSFNLRMKEESWVTFLYQEVKNLSGVFFPNIIKDAQHFLFEPTRIVKMSLQIHVPLSQKSIRNLFVFQGWKGERLYNESQ